ncbi:MAG TPA: cyclic nucleotide-binding domain-containing protein [Candidatus Kapabacteria bacterium]|nr:cyclic nucleotide-binding domain-containing protein [Candidatus Kapabacteria bacterium]
MPALLTEGCLKDHPFLNDCTSSFLNHLEEFAREVTFEPGQVILKEREYGDKFYLIRSGKVRLELGTGKSTITIQLLKAGDILGCSWLNPPFEWHFTARALDRCELVELNAASLLIRAEEDSEFGYQLMKRLSIHMVQRLEALSNRLKLELQRHQR